MISSSDSESSVCVLKDAPKILDLPARLAVRVLEEEDDGRKAGGLSGTVDADAAVDGDTIARCWALACIAAITAGFPPVLEAMDCTAEGEGPDKPCWLRITAGFAS